MSYLLAIGSAALYGAADFLGGLASRRTNTISIVVTSQGAGLVLLALMLPLLPDAAPSGPDVFWGGAAGLTGGVGVALLYRALAVGTMAVVAPTTAVCAVMIPVVTGVFCGEQLARLTVLGIALVLVAIVLVSQQRPAVAPSHPHTVAPSHPRTVAPSHRRTLAPSHLVPPGVGIALASGVAIGLFFLALARTRAQAGLWPLLAARAVSVSLFGIMALVTARPLRMAAPVARMAVAGGALDMIANALYLLATRYGSLSVVVTLASLYPASTVLLARIALREHLNGWQIAGVACALAAIALIVSGG